MSQLPAPSLNGDELMAAFRWPRRGLNRVADPAPATYQPVNATRDPVCNPIENIEISVLPLTAVTFHAPTPMLLQFQARLASLPLPFKLAHWFQSTAAVCMCPCPKRFRPAARPFIIPRACFLTLPSCSHHASKPA